MDAVEPKNMDGKFYPLNFNIENKLCVVIGFGNVGRRKVDNLLNYKCKIKVIDPKLIDIEKYLNLSKVEFIKDFYKKEYIKDANLVFACTNDKNLNLKIYNDAKKWSAMVNIITHPNLCDFTVPSVISKGKIKIAISTEGVSPALSRLIKKKINEVIDYRYETVANLLEKIREKQLTACSSSDKNKEKFYKFLNSEIFEIIEDKEKTRKLIKDIFGFELE